ncbi:cytochrome c oxidase subunit 4 [Curtobacterium sp. MCJR17_055]|uniref:cytochrome c oxidase subunit 4 n=1 Tax=unclassified Curtobacterium TaxID=257496 RepID=UPI000D97DD32|nr:MULTISPECIES: cytochrome c oxidase subunit 4 [unclassified Curtobacterium]PYY34167.1 cytochrome c oxidase subunit 4 [Curtobacterium sp. MCBD17_029]PYY43168.1 cytochrome c oxidase subunit 4 [Curtobacterium sp. MCPF17_046]PYY50759.1 cytochrome c oxidase subunit 4 [Curtobacterium sp. MCBD17_023]PYY54018.1 cytochrome c oxidase subunit 4 [Curtobacterium sp. MCJR17_055]PYY59095.1 cytochrome c oxidase subunit 4 [Curtobacterium sp. MCPF17_015]
MRANTNLFWILFIFFVIADAAYTIWSVIYYGNIEWVGTLSIGLTGIMSAFIAFYLGRVMSAQGGVLPEDRQDANIEDGDAELGHFSPWSWWPIFLAAAIAVCFLGVAAGLWIVPIGLALVAITLVGWVYEYYRGNFGH